MTRRFWNWIRVLSGLRQSCEVPGCDLKVVDYVHVAGVHVVVCQGHKNIAASNVLYFYDLLTAKLPRSE
ncbi:MAG: hypothetical protein KIS29_10435 [Thermoplasmata archaeon]|nr:hypothetical protein [Candidatus Sysuiplasma jiujiangense]